MPSSGPGGTYLRRSDFEGNEHARFIAGAFDQKQPPSPLNKAPAGAPIRDSSPSPGDPR